MTKKRKIYPIIFLIIGYLTNLIYISINGLNLLNSDASSEMVLANLLNKTGGILTNQWYYSTELRVINTQLLYKLALRLFPQNWHMARVFSVAIFLLILIASALYLVWAAELGVPGIWAVGALVWPFGQWYAWNTIYCSYYIPHIVFTMLSIGLLLQILRMKSKRKYLGAAGLVVIGFLAGLGGNRQLMVCYVPLLFALMMILLIHFLKVVPVTREKYHADGREVQAVILTLILTAGAVIGYLVNTHIFAQLYHFTNMDDTTWQTLELSKAWDVLADLIGLFGWQPYQSIMTLKGIANVIGLFFGIVVLYDILWSLWHFVKLTLAERIMVLYVVCAILTDGLIFSQSSRYNESYWLPIVPIMVLVLGVKTKAEMRLYEESGAQPKRLLGIKAISFVLVLLIGSINTMQSPYPDTVSNDISLRKVAQWLEENGYTEGYASFWNSNIITELTNGTVEMWTVNGDFTTLNQYEWLQETAHCDMTSGQPENGFFILVSSNELADGGASLADEQIYADDTYSVYYFDSMEQYMSFMQTE